MNEPDIVRKLRREDQYARLQDKLKSREEKSQIKKYHDAIDEDMMWFSQWSGI